jgi:hypothetical protein
MDDEGLPFDDRIDYVFGGEFRVWDATTLIQDDTGLGFEQVFVGIGNDIDLGVAFCSGKTKVCVYVFSCEGYVHGWERDAMGSIGCENKRFL